MKVIFWGTPKFAVPSLEAIIKNGYEVTAVVTQPDRRRGRGNKNNYSPIKQIAINNDIKIFTPSHIKSDKPIQEEIFKLKADIFIVVAFGQILPQNVLEHPPYGCWNSHGSLLPRWRGAAPIQWSLLSGDQYTGLAIMHMEEGLDTGPVLMQKELKIDHQDNYKTLSEKLSTLSATLLISSIKTIYSAGKLKSSERNNKLGLKQQDTLNQVITYARTINKKDLLLNWKETSDLIHRKVNAYFPNAYTYWNNKRLKILSVETLSKVNHKTLIDFKLENYNLKKLNNKEGEILGYSSKYGIMVVTKDIPIIIRTAQIEGKNISSENVLIQQLKPVVGDLLKGS